MALKLFEFNKHLMIDILLINLNQFEKTGSIGNFSDSTGKTEH